MKFGIFSPLANRFAIPEFVTALGRADECGSPLHLRLHARDVIASPPRTGGTTSTAAP